MKIGAVEVASKFEPGQIVATPPAVDLLAEHGVDPAALLKRHLEGDWGDMCDEDKALNDEAIKHVGEDAGRVHSSYPVGPAERDLKVWVITEYDRSVTTFLLPEDY